MQEPYYLETLTFRRDGVYNWGKSDDRRLQKSADMGEGAVKNESEKNVGVLYGRPLCELCCWANIANLSTEVAAGFENAPKT